MKGILVFADGLNDGRSIIIIDNYCYRHFRYLLCFNQRLGKYAKKKKKNVLGISNKCST